MTVIAEDTSEASPSVKTPDGQAHQNAAATTTAAADDDDTNTTKKGIRVAVGSKNPVKINAVRRALETVLKSSASPMDIEVQVQVQGFDVPSEVSDQPFGDEETQLGAKNRAEGAYRKYKEANGTYPNLAVGLEGGLEWSSTVQDGNDEDTLWCMAWMAVHGKRTTLLAECLASSDSKFYTADKKPICCLSKTGTFLLPSSLAKHIEDGMELGHADDKVFGRVNSKRKSGTVGVLTDGIIDRTAYYEHALILALVPWIRPDVYATPAKPQTNRQDSVESAVSSDSKSTSLIGSLFCSSRKS